MSAKVSPGVPDKRRRSIGLAATGLAQTINAAKIKHDLANALAEQQASRKRRAVQRGERTPCYILYPDDRLVMLRDALSLLALILTFVIVPFEVSFVETPPEPDPTDGLWIFNRIVDCMFLYDLGLQVLLPGHADRNPDPNR